MDNVQNARDFQAQGRRTWATDPHPSLTRGWELLQDIDRATQFLDGTLDEHKRALFYGDESANVLHGTPGRDFMLEKLGENEWDFMHAGLGLLTEAGETMEEIVQALTASGEIDAEAVKEELGDLLYYVARAADAADTSLLEIMQANNRKLRERFPEEFDADQALNRDLGAERETLEVHFEENEGHVRYLHSLAARLYDFGFRQRAHYNGPRQPCDVIWTLGIDQNTPDEAWALAEKIRGLSKSERRVVGERFEEIVLTDPDELTASQDVDPVE